MRQTIQKYRTNTLTPDETMLLREKISTYTDEQIGEAIYEDWQDFEPEIPPPKVRPLKISLH